MALQIADSFTGAGIRHDLGSNDNLYVSSGIRSISIDNLAITGVGTLHSIQIDGIVFGRNAGIFLDVSGAISGNNSVAISKTGQLGSEGSAISFTGYGNLLINHGEINTMFGSAVVFGNGTANITPSKVINYGSISADSAGVVSDGPAIIVRNYGDITASFGSAISAGSGNDIVQNFGTLDGVVNLRDGADKLINRGLIAGDVNTEFADDMVDNRFGTIHGDVKLGDGADTFKPGQSDETVDGETGRDTLDFSSSTGVQFALDGSVSATGWAEGDSFTNFENITGSLNGADVLIGNSLTNTLIGKGGNDMLAGKAGNDTLEGGFGNDTIDGGAGKDAMSGGAGKDLFVFANGDFGGRTSGTADVISDFSQADGDQIDLKLVDAKSTVAGDQAFTFIGTAAFHNVAGELRFVQGASSTVVQGDTNGDGAADFWITLTGSITLKAADFVL